MLQVSLIDFARWKIELNLKAVWFDSGLWGNGAITDERRLIEDLAWFLDQFLQTLYWLPENLQFGLSCSHLHLLLLWFMVSIFETQSIM